MKTLNHFGPGDQVIVKKTKAFAGEPAPFIMELSSYHFLPSKMFRAQPLKEAGHLSNVLVQ